MLIPPPAWTVALLVTVTEPGWNWEVKVSQLFEAIRRLAMVGSVIPAATARPLIVRSAVTPETESGVLVPGKPPLSITIRLF